MKHASCMQLDSSSRVRWRKKERRQRVVMLAEPEEQDTDDHESNISTEHAEDVERDHLRDPEVEWLEPLVRETGEVPPVDAPVATPAQRMSHFLALRLVWGSPSARDLQQTVACSQD